MPDDRFFHKRLGHSEKVRNLTDFEYIVWSAYVLSADDFGLMRFSSLALQADHDRLANRTRKAVQRALETVLEVGLIRTFEHQGRIYCYQWDWQDWQKITYPKRTSNPPLSAAVLGACSENTRWLFEIFPGGQKLPSWQAPRKSSVASPKTFREEFPKTFREEFPIHSSLTRERALAMANGNGHGLERGAGENHLAVDPDSPSTAPPELADRAGTFCNETYPRLYAKHRKGARYVSKPALDFGEAMLLCQTWDDGRLEKIATVFLTTDHEFAEKGSRTIGQLRSMASWCDGKLREAGL